ncbi:hypothetical protein GW17_00062144 [Ensete ventricosum]|nr:hypothetical protein GW17_00062144 [Ensete ventricosum]
MSDLPTGDPEAPLEAWWSSLKQGTQVWVDGSISAKYARGVLLPTLAVDLYSSSSEVLMDRVPKSMVLTQHYCMALANHAHDAGQVISLMDNKAEGLKKEIVDLRAGSGPKAVAAIELKADEAQTLVDDLKVELEEASRRWALLETKVDNYRVDLADSREQLKEVRAGRRTLEDELLKITGAMEKLKVELLAEAIAEYKNSVGFEMGLVHTCQVSYEYGYRVALA